MGIFQKTNRKKLLYSLWTCFCILLGNALLAFLVAAFVIPHDLLMGGTTGIGILLSNAFKKLCFCFCGNAKLIYCG